MRISICLLTYKRPEQLAKLLQSIHQQSWAPAPQDMEIIIVDTSLGNAASEVVESYRKRLPCLRFDMTHVAIGEAPHQDETVVLN